MRRRGRLALAAGALALAAACLPCRSRKDCDSGHFCEFESGECIQGCTGPADCAPTARCDLELGQCKPASGSRVDLDAGTSTAADAGG